MKKRNLIANGPLILLVLLACEGAVQSESLRVADEVTFLGWKFSLVLPQSVSATREKPIHDLETYSFKVNADPKSDLLLYASASNHPSFPLIAPEGSQFQKITIGVLEAKSFEWVDKSGRFHRETLVQLPKDFGVPRYVHFRYKKLTAEERLLADRIIGSIRPVEAKPKG